MVAHVIPKDTMIIALCRVYKGSKAHGPVLKKLPFHNFVIYPGRLFTGDLCRLPAAVFVSERLLL